jgi:hypothetical protein
VTNEIQRVREATEQALASARLCPGGPVTELSPCGRYRLEIEQYAYEQGVAPAVAVVRRTADGQEVATVKSNDGSFYAWLARAGRDFLLFPEDLEGQTVIDLTTGQVASFSSPDDPFIWTTFHLSPDGTKLAVVGCYWACPYQVTVYNFHEPLNLPLPKLAEFELPDNDAEFEEWVTEGAFRVRSKDGSVRVFEVQQGGPADPAGAPKRPSN